MQVLGEPPESAAAALQAAGGRCAVDDIMMREREAVMCKVAADLAAEGGAGVALVVGSAHLPGGSGS